MPLRREGCRRVLSCFSVAVVLSPSAVLGGLDVGTYEEPADTYWASSPNDKPPFNELRLKSSELISAAFDKKIIDGDVFVVDDVGKDWPMAQWNCEFFQKDALFSSAAMSQMYSQSGGSGFVGFQSDWLGNAGKSGAKDPDAPQVAPYYWGIKDVQHADAHKSKTWRMSMLKKVQEHVRLPAFMHESNLANFKTTPEFWFSGPGAGASAHMDTHVQATISLQLAGTKRWRLRYMDERQAPHLAFLFGDGEVYKRGKWQPFFNLTLKPGEALFFPPGFIHETMNTNEGEESCAASVTFQFAAPFATRLYRRFLPRVRRTADIHEAWPLIADWASLQTGRGKNGKLSAEEARREALGDEPKTVGAAFKNLDKDGDNMLTLQEFQAMFRRSHAAVDILSFHDLNEDGKVTREEFADVFSFWAGTVKRVVEETPKAYRSYQLKDMEEGKDGEQFNIEDLSPGVRKKMAKLAFAQEAEALAGTAKKVEL